MIVLGGVEYDVVVQRDGLDWCVADSDGTIYSRHASERAACDAANAFRQNLLAIGGREVAA